MKTGIIAFCGSKGSGKSTSATLFKQLVQMPTEELAIAGLLKETCASVFKVPYDSFIDPAKKEVELDELIVLDSTNLKTVLERFFVPNISFDKHIRPHLGKVLLTPRELLQYIGTEVLHPIDPLIHIKATLKNKDPNKLTLITDLRFVAEFEHLHYNSEIPFTPVYVKNSAAEQAASVDSHPSERQLFAFNMRCRLLQNEERNLESLKSQLRKLITEVYE